MTFAAENLACVRGDRLVFEGLGFELAPGGAILLEGPNGSGKSSLLRICATFLDPAEGRLVWDGADVNEDRDAFRARIHYVGHQDPLKPVFTVAENLRFWAALGGGDEARIAAALTRFDLEGLADIPARLLSAGQKRRANLARVIAAPAELWLLDEPSTSLDAASTRTLSDVIGEHCAAGGMVMASTHLNLGLAGAERLAMEEFAVPL